MCPASSSRWCPTPEQLMTLRKMYRNGVRTPNASQIQHITAHLSLYGKIEGKNVFYWFQNHKTRDRQKLRGKLNKQLHLQLQQQQQLNYHHHHHHLSQTSHFLYDLGSGSGSTSISTFQLPFYNSVGLFPKRGAREASKQAKNYPWKMGKPEALKENTMLTTFYNEDWTMMVDVGPPPCCCPKPLKTLELFPITDRLKAAE